MGKEQSKLTTTLTASAAAGTVSGEITLKNLLRVQKTIVKEYPFLESVYESMLLTDCSLPDCPIVFANEQVCFIFFSSSSSPSSLLTLLLHLLC